MARTSRRTARYNADPFWITARRGGVCARKGCDIPVREGERVFYFPNVKSTYGHACGHGDEAHREFEAARFDEEIA